MSRILLRAEAPETMKPYGVFGRGTLKTIAFSVMLMVLPKVEEIPLFTPLGTKEVKVKERKVRQILLVARDPETADNGARKASAAEAMIAPGLKATPLKTKIEIKENKIENKAEAVPKEKGNPKGHETKPQTVKPGALQMKEKHHRRQRRALFEVNLPVVKRIVLLVFNFSKETALKERVAMTCIPQNAGIIATQLYMANALEERTVIFCIHLIAKRHTMPSYRLLTPRRKPSSPTCYLDFVLMAFQLRIPLMS